jgi:hypothetical protein
MGSGGHNRVSVEDHLLRANFHPHRHGGPSAAPPVPVSAADRRFALQGLPPVARRLANRLINQHSDATALDLEHVQNFVLCAARVREMQATETGSSPALARELRNYERLSKLLTLERS